jgi:hypothetical protein
VVEDYKEGRDITLEQANVVLFSAEFIKKPIYFDESWKFSHKVHQRK